MFAVSVGSRYTGTVIYGKIILVPLATGLIAQFSKVLVEAVNTGTVNLKLLNRYGGMPSSHTALVVSLSTVVGIVNGFNSAAFAIAVVFSLITIRDAIGFRMYLGEHATIINKLVGELPAKEKPKFPTHIIERIGHTPLQAFIGGLVGLTTTLILWSILP